MTFYLVFITTGFQRVRTIQNRPHQKMNTVELFGFVHLFLYNSLIGI